MAATVEISESNSAGETVTDGVTRGDWLSADSEGDSDKRSTYPITKPPSGNTYAFEKWHRLHVSAWGGSQQIESIRHWVDSLPGSGWTIQTSAQTGVPSDETFDTPSDSDSVEADQAFATSDPAAANISGTLTGGTVYSGYVVSQSDVDNTATAGFAQTVSWRYAEIA